MKFDISLLEDFISISTKNDINPLIQIIESILDSKTSCNDIVLIAKQQILCVENTLDNIILSEDLIIDDQLELFSYHINEAIKRLRKHIGFYNTKRKHKKTKRNIPESI